MAVKLLLIVLVSVAVFFLVARGWPKISNAFRGRLLPLLMTPIAFQLLRRLVWMLLRLFLFRR